MGKKPPEHIDRKKALTDSLETARVKLQGLADNLELTRTFGKDLLRIQILRVQMDDYKRSLRDA